MNADEAAFALTQRTLTATWDEYVLVAVDENGFIRTGWRGGSWLRLMGMVESAKIVLHRELASK